MWTDVQNLTAITSWWHLLCMVAADWDILRHQLKYAAQPSSSIIASPGDTDRPCDWCALQPQHMCPVQVQRYLSYQLQYVNSAVNCQLLCNPSSQLQSVYSLMICQLGSSLSMQSVSSAAIRQLSCNVSAQLHPGSSSTKLVISAARSAATCQLSCTLLAQMTFVILAATCRLSCSLSSFGLCPLGRSLSTQLYSVSLTVICQLNSHMLAQLQSLSAHLYSCCQLISSCQGQVAGNKAQCIQRRSYTTISSGWHMLPLMLAKRSTHRWYMRMLAADQDNQCTDQFCDSLALECNECMSPLPQKRKR